MTTDKLIFGPRFRLHENIQPTQKQLNLFLENVDKIGGRTMQANDRSRYRELLKNADAFKQNQPHVGVQRDLREHMFYAVLDHAQIVSHQLLSVVEEYVYHLHSLTSLDFHTSTQFLRATEKEMGRLNKNKLDDVIRMARLQEMIDDHKHILADLKKHWVPLAAELLHIGMYIRDNLVKIEKLCQTALSVLSDLELGKKKEQQLIGEIKTFFKEQLKEALHRDQVTRQYLEKAKKEVDLIAEQISALVTEDIHELAALYSAILEHARKKADELTILLADLENKKGGSVEENKKLFSQVELVLGSLISNVPLELKTTKILAGTAHEAIITKKRKEMIEYLLDQTQQDRRSFKDRRKSGNPDYKGPERRTGKERRAGKSKRGTKDVLS